MPRSAFVTLGCLASIALYFAIAWAWRHEPIRSRRIAQERPLMEGIRMRTEDLFLYPTSNLKVLRVKCRYLGGDPNRNHYLRASIRTTPNGPEIDPSNMWQVPVPDDRQGGIPMIWEFRTAPEEARRFIMRVYFRPLDTHAASPVERYVDYDLPYLPNLTPQGEIGV